MAESFFATLECELIDRRSWQTKTEARLALFTYIEGWYSQLPLPLGLVALWEDVDDEDVGAAGLQLLRCEIGQRHADQKADRGRYWH